MSHQVSFWMHPEDAQEFVGYLQTEHELDFAGYTYPTPIPQRIENIILSESDKFDFWCDSTIFLIPAKKWDHIQVRPSLNKWTIDLDASLAIEFHRSIVTAQTIKIGRIYFKTENKPETFIKLGDTLIRWIRKRYHQRSRGFYIGPHAMTWLQNASCILVDIWGKDKSPTTRRQTDG